jgi:hypothetical protein
VKKIKVVKVEVVACDFCGKEESGKDGNFAMSRCVVCGKDVCGRHLDSEWSEDGVLCPDHAKLYEFQQGEEWGTVRLVEIATGQTVNHLWKY